MIYAVLAFMFLLNFFVGLFCHMSSVITGCAVGAFFIVLLAVTTKQSRQSFINTLIFWGAATSGQWIGLLVQVLNGKNVW